MTTYGKEHWGLFATTGEAIVNPRHDALTGEPCQRGVTIRLSSNHNLFYRLSPASRRKLTGEQRTEIENGVLLAHAEWSKQHETQPTGDVVPSTEPADDDSLELPEKDVKESPAPETLTEPVGVKEAGKGKGKGKSSSTKK